MFEIKNKIWENKVNACYKSNNYKSIVFSYSSKSIHYFLYSRKLNMPISLKFNK